MEGVSEVEAFLQLLSKIKAKKLNIKWRRISLFHRRLSRSGENSSGCVFN